MRWRCRSAARRRTATFWRSGGRSARPCRPPLTLTATAFATTPPSCTPCPRAASPTGVVATSSSPVSSASAIPTRRRASRTCSNYDNFRWQYTAPNTVDSWSATRNGSRTLTATSAQLSLSNQVSIVRTFARRADATVAHNTLLVFTPDAGNELVRGTSLPSGTAVKSGQVTFSRNGNVRTLHGQYGRRRSASTRRAPRPPASRRARSTMSCPMDPT